MCVKIFMAHVLNPLHVYCRLLTLLYFIGVDEKISIKIAKYVCRWYEYSVYRTIIINLFKISTKGR